MKSLKMAQLISDFSTKYSDDCHRLIIIDASTPHHGGQTILSRTIEIDTADGENVVLDFPILEGVGDTLLYDISKDMVGTIRLTITPQTPENDSVYAISKNIISTCRIDKKRDELVREHLLQSDPKNLLQLKFHEIRRIFLLDTYLKLSVQYLAYEDFTTSQEALDAANEVADSDCH